MHNFNSLKNGILLLTFLTAAASEGFGQEQADSSQYSTDTTTVATNQQRVEGVKLSGKVVDGNTNAPLVGVSLSIPGFSATITKENGEFSLTIPDYRSTISVSQQGYHTRLYPVVKGRTLIARLYPETFPSMFAAINLPFGTKSLSRTVASVSSQTGQDWSSNSETVSSNFQGRLAGVNSIRRSGTSGIGAEVFVRGFTSLYSSNKPLYIVDGMIYDVNSYGTSLTYGHTNNPLQHLDPRDIASVTVIKDAVQAGAYGTRAANGVVVITTSHATELATKIDFSAYGGFNSAPGNYPVLNAYDYRTYLTDILTTSGYSASQIESFSYMNDNVSNPEYFATHNDTKWQKQVFRNSYDQNYYLKISGGDNVAKYSLALGYLQDKGITDSTDYLRYNTRFNADLNLTQRLTGKVNLAFTYGLQNIKDQGISPITNPIFLSLVKSPFFNVNQISANGAVSPKLSDVDVLGIGNPRALIEDATNGKKTYRFSGSTDFNYKLSNTLNLSTLLGITYDKNQESSFVPRLGVADELVDAISLIDSRLGTQVIRFYGLSTDTRLNYKKTFQNIHSLNANLGFRYNDNESEQDQVRGFNSGTDQLISIGNSNSFNRIFGGAIGKWKTLNTYLTGDYSYADKYLLNASLAVDGSSRFGNKVKDGLTLNGNKFAVLPAIGAAWLVSSEDFMRDIQGIDLLKLRLSYGLVGNDDIGNYTARRSYRSQNLVGLQGLVRGNIANPYLQWEVVRKFNTGIDISAFNERLSFSFDYWNNQTDKMLTVQKVDEVAAGIDSYLSNNAGMRTTGIDLGVNSRILNGSVKWDAGITLGKYKNTVTKLASSEPIYTDYAGGTYITSIGNDANLFYGYRTNGVYSTEAEAQGENLSVQVSNGTLIPFKAGDMRFEDINGDNIIDQNDRVIIGNPNPDLYGSFNNAVSLKKWRVDALFTFVSGNDIYNYNRAQLESGSTVFNQTSSILNRWRVAGQQTNVPKASFGDPMGNSRFSDRWIEDGSYLRLRTLAVTYSLPFNAKAFKYLNIYATANNVFKLSNYKGFDPEFSASESIFTQGTDTTLEPQFKSFQLGLRLGL